MKFLDVLKEIYIYLSSLEPKETSLITSERQILHSKKALSALNRINNDNISILPRDTNGKNNGTLRQVEELYAQGVRIFIGPVFNKNLNGLDKYKDAYFLSLTNKILNNPSNVISAGINARSQFNAIKKYQKLNNLEKTLILIPKKDYKEEIELAIKEILVFI